MVAAHEHTVMNLALAEQGAAVRAAPFECTQPRGRAHEYDIDPVRGDGMGPLTANFGGTCDTLPTIAAHEACDRIPSRPIFKSPAARD
jgi:hypothetical protein